MDYWAKLFHALGPVSVLGKTKTNRSSWEAS